MRDAWYRSLQFREPHSACGILQSRNLRLAPWEIAPCNSDPRELDHRRQSEIQARKQAAQQFADEMRRAGLSVFDSDPQRALAAVAEVRQQQALYVVEPTDDAA